MMMMLSQGEQSALPTSFVGCDASRKAMAFNDSVQKYGLKNEASSNIKNNNASLFGFDVGIYLWDGSFSTDIGIVKLHPKKSTL